MTLAILLLSVAAILAVVPVARRLRGLPLFVRVVAALVAGALAVDAVFVGERDYRAGEGLAEAAQIEADVCRRKIAAATTQEQTLEVLRDLLRAVEALEAGSKLGGFEWWTRRRALALLGPCQGLYGDLVAEKLVAPYKAQLEQRLTRDPPPDLGRVWRDLRHYLMLGDPDHLDADEETTALSADFARLPARHAPDLTRVAQAYFERVKRGALRPTSLDSNLVQRARARIAAAPLEDRAYAWLVDAYRFGPVDVTLADVLSDTPAMLGFFEVPGGKAGPSIGEPFTSGSQRWVFENLAHASRRLESQRWVAPTAFDFDPARVDEIAATVARDYDRRFSEAWSDWLRAVRFRELSSVKEALWLYEGLVSANDPLLKILSTVAMNTMWPAPSIYVREGPSGARLRNAAWSAKTPRDFAPIAAFTGGSRATFPARDYFNALSKYRRIVARLSTALRQARGSTDRDAVDRDLERATEATLALLASMDDGPRGLLCPLLTDVFRIRATRAAARADTCQDGPETKERTAL